MSRNVISYIGLAKSSLLYSPRLGERRMACICIIVCTTRDTSVWSSIFGVKIYQLCIRVKEASSAGVRVYRRHVRHVVTAVIALVYISLIMHIFEYLSIYCI